MIFDMRPKRAIKPARIPQRFWPSNAVYKLAKHSLPQGTSLKQLLIGMATGIAVCASSAHAHEVWITAKDWHVSPGEPIVADLKNGELFKGVTLPWLPRSIERAEIRSGETVTPLSGRAGDVPALTALADQAGLQVIGYHSKPAALTYDTYAKFQHFADEKGYADLIADMPQTPRPRELFSRYAKALVAVGDGAGADVPFGFEIELIAETNPYRAPEQPMVVRLMYQGAALPQTRITVFDRDETGAVTVSQLTSDANGHAQFPQEAGHHYLVDAVMLRKPAPKVIAEHRVLWESHWASLTFAVPDGQ